MDFTELLVGMLYPIEHDFHGVVCTRKIKKAFNLIGKNAMVISFKDDSKDLLLIDSDYMLHIIKSQEKLSKLPDFDTYMKQEKAAGNKLRVNEELLK